MTMSRSTWTCEARVSRTQSNQAELSGRTLCCTAPRIALKTVTLINYNKGCCKGSRIGHMMAASTWVATLRRVVHSSKLTSCKRSSMRATIRLVASHMITKVWTIMKRCSSLSKQLKLDLLLPKLWKQRTLSSLRWGRATLAILTRPRAHYLCKRAGKDSAFLYQKCKSQTSLTEWPTRKRKQALTWWLIPRLIGRTARMVSKRLTTGRLLSQPYLKSARSRKLITTAIS